MLKRKYNILMETPIGDRPGTMEVQIEYGQVNGCLNVLEHSETFEGEIDEQGNCCISGKIITLLNTIPYTATGRIETDTLELALKGKKNIFNITGTRI
ncbi:MAG: hypothetical protein ACI4S0_01860 [Dorea sp.]